MSHERKTEAGIRVAEAIGEGRIAGDRLNDVLDLQEAGLGADEIGRQLGIDSELMAQIFAAYGFSEERA